MPLSNYFKTEIRDFIDLPNRELEHLKDFNLIAIYLMKMDIEKNYQKIKVLRNTWEKRIMKLIKIMKKKITSMNFIRKL